MAEITLVKEAQKMVKLEDQQLNKGDIVLFDNGSYAMVVATSGTNEYQLSVISDGKIFNGVGNYWGRTFKMGTTVGEKNNELSSAQIKAIYKKGTYGLALTLAEPINIVNPVGDAYQLEKPVKEPVRVTAQVGDYIKVTGNGDHKRKDGSAVGRHGFAIGYVGRVIGFNKHGDCVEVEDNKGIINWYVHHDDYEIVPEPKALKVGDRIVITAKRKYGTMYPHNFTIGEIVKVDRIFEDLVFAKRIKDGKLGLDDCWFVHNDDYRVVVDGNGEIGEEAVVLKDRGGRNCLHGFKDGDVVKLERKCEMFGNKRRYQVTNGRISGYGNVGEDFIVVR